MKYRSYVKKMKKLDIWVMMLFDFLPAKEHVVMTLDVV